jgi:hypothetical protein
MNNQSLIVSTAIGLVLQLIMVVVGHYVPAIREKGFAIGGMTISLLAGVIYVYRARGAWPDSLIGGAVAGGVCALLGIAVSVALKDVPVMILMVGTIASIVTGVVGAALGKLIFK